MVSRRDFLKKSGLAMMAAAVSTTPLKAVAKAMAEEKELISNRPLPANRRFMSKAVEEVIESVKRQLKDPKLAWMFENCFPNTLDTTVDFQMKDGRPDTFVKIGRAHV